MKKMLFCVECDERRDWIAKSTEIVHDIKGESIVFNCEIPYCSICNSKLSDLETEERHFEIALIEYRKRKNLLFPEQIKEIRGKYNLSQRAFARALGFAEATINRYESGVLQDTLHNNVLVLVNTPNNFLTMAKLNSDKLSDVEFLNISKKVTELTSDVLENPTLELECKGQQVLEHEAYKRLELMILGLNKHLENLERKIDSLANESESESELSITLKQHYRPALENRVSKIIDKSLHWHEDQPYNTLLNRIGIRGGIRIDKL